MSNLEPLATVAEVLAAAKAESPPQDRLDEMERQWRAFHQAHPEVWDLFERFAFDVVRRGRKRYGVGAIMERVRWHYSIDRTSLDHDDDFKINNNFRAFYAREFVRRHPEHADLFELREQISAGKPPREANL